MFTISLGDEPLANIVRVKRKIRTNNKFKWKNYLVFKPVGRFKEFLNSDEKVQQKDK